MEYNTGRVRDKVELNYSESIKVHQSSISGLKTNQLHAICKESHILNCSTGIIILTPRSPMFLKSLPCGIL